MRLRFSQSRSLGIPRFLVLGIPNSKGGPLLSTIPPIFFCFLSYFWRDHFIMVSWEELSQRASTWTPASLGPMISPVLQESEAVCDSVQTSGQTDTCDQLANY